MTDDATTDARPAKPRIRLRWLHIAIAIAFGLLYAYDLFEATSNLFGVQTQIAEYNQAAAALELNPVPVPWALLIGNLLLAPVGFVVAFLLGRRRNPALAALIFLAGLAAISALSLSLTALA